MIGYDLSEHARNLLKERKIHQTWIQRAIANPVPKEDREDGTVHYLAPIKEREGRILRVIANPGTSSIRIVTAFFDRRLRRQP